jgi:hypothetical protein
MMTNFLKYLKSLKIPKLKISNSNDAGYQNDWNLEFAIWNL